MKKLLFITDLFKNKNHNAIEGIFNGYLKEFFEIDLIFFDQKAKDIDKIQNKIIFPYKLKNRIRKDLNKKYDIVIVRNRFDILKQFLENKDYKLGFQLSFPHSFRRYYEAKITKKALFRKKIEFEIKDFLQKRDLKKCDFFLPISESMYNIFYYDLKIPYFPLPLGIDPKNEIEKKPKKEKTLKFIYIGTIDRLREFETIFKAFLEIKGDFILEIYTPNFKYANSILNNLTKNQEKIKIYPPIEREKLLKKLPLYDVGISLIPESILYLISSPTKIMEYYEAKIPSLMSKIPECMEIFCDKEEGWICSFNKDEIKKKIKEILSTPKEEISNMGERGFKKLLLKRNYQKISQEFYQFILNLH